jgi:hypothetical protein
MGHGGAPTLCPFIGRQRTWTAARPPLRARALARRETRGPGHDRDWAGVGGEEAVGSKPVEQLDPRADPEALVEPREIRLDGPAPKPQGGADLLVRPPRRQEASEFPLAGAEVATDRFAGRGELTRREGELTRGCCGHDPRQLVGAARDVDEPRRTPLQRLGDEGASLVAGSVGPAIAAATRDPVRVLRIP